MWNSSKVQAIGSCRLKVTNPSNNKKYLVDFVVVDDNGLTPLLGAKASQHMGFITVNSNRLICMNVSPTMQETLKKCFQGEFSVVFDGSLGKLPGTVHLEIDPSIKPTVLPPRRVPHAIKSQLMLQLDEMVKKGILSINQLSG